ncbi:MAG: hypothetical protein SFV15_16180 [Polyangiaceae bacterium]|nr:hypothetical protein [Polyangiaceae bacterium]
MNVPHRHKLVLPIFMLWGCTLESANVQEFALGGQHSCALLGDGSVKCWGFRGGGAVGDGKPLGHGFPDIQTSAVSVQGLGARATQITAGWNWSCALLETGAVKCWGTPVGGAISDLPDPAMAGRPTTVPGLEANVQAISGQFITACALKTDGSVWCWGENNLQWVEPKGWQKAPVLISFPLPARLIATGSTDLCTVLLDNSIWCSSSEGPARLLQLPNVEWQALAVGGNYACALAPGGALYCWNGAPPLKKSHYDDSSILLMELDAPVAQMGLGWSHACAIFEGPSSGQPIDPLRGNLGGTLGGRMRCWGYGVAGVLGASIATRRTCADDNEACVSDTPVAPVGLGDVKRIGAGYARTCAEQTDGQVFCWGDNLTGALGNGNRWDSFTPTRVHGL